MLHKNLTPSTPPQEKIKRKGKKKTVKEANIFTAKYKNTYQHMSIKKTNKWKSFLSIRIQKVESSDEGYYPHSTLNWEDHQQYYRHVCDFFLQAIKDKVSHNKALQAALGLKDASTGRGCLSEESNCLSHLLKAFWFHLIWNCSLSTDFNNNSLLTKELSPFCKRTESQQPNALPKISVWDCAGTQISWLLV